MSVASRVAKLSHEALIELVVAACEESPAIKNRADALVAQVAPLPAWCVEVLLSPDLLSACFSSLKLTDSRVAATCSTWRTAWHGWLAVLRPVLPAVQRTIPYLDRANGLCVRADGTLAVCYQNSRVRFLTSDGEEDLSCLRREGEIHALEMPTKLLHFDGSTFVADDFTIRKFGPDGTELASYSHPDTDEGECMPDIVVHPPSGALFTAVTLWHEDEGGGHVVLELDAATLQPRLDTNGEADYFAPDRLANSKVKTVCLTLEKYLGKHKHSLFTRQHRDAKGKKTFDLQGSWKIGHGSTQVGHKQHVGKKRFQHTHACTRLLLQVAVHNTVLAAQRRARTLSASASGTPGATGTRSAEP